MNQTTEKTNTITKFPTQKMLKKYFEFEQEQKLHDEINEIESQPEESCARCGHVKQGYD